MEEKRTKKYKLLIHCRLYQIRKGFEEHLGSLPVSFATHYTDLNDEGILSELRFAPHLIVVLLNEGDSDFILPWKIKLFAPHIPLLVILPKVPETYRNHLKETGVNEIIQLPEDDQLISGTIIQLLSNIKGEAR